MARINRIRCHPISILPLSIILLNQIIGSSAYTLAQSLTVESKLQIKTNNKLERFNVLEHIDSSDGNLRLAIEEADKPALVRYVYFRLDANSALETPEVTLYDERARRCYAQSLDNWRLAVLSKSMHTLLQGELFAGALSDTGRRSAIGPVGLLKLVSAKKQLFRLDSYEYDSMEAENRYLLYFSCLLTNSNHAPNKLRIIVALPYELDAGPLMEQHFNRLLGKSWLELEDSERLGHPNRVAIVESTRRKDSEACLEHYYSHQLLRRQFEDADLFDTITVDYHLITERSISKHLGHASFGVDFNDLDNNPFIMPTGAGCAQALPKLTLQTRAQFSARFEAADLRGQYFVAYDRATNHLRLDKEGHFKMIYALGHGLITFIPYGMSEINNATEIHCAQSMDLAKEDQFTNDLARASTVEDLLGLGSDQMPLTYLGSTIASDETLTRVYEREIDARKVPLLVKMNIRLSLKYSDKISLVYYFSDSLAGNTASSVREAKLARLAKIELVSSLKQHSYKFTNARLTFTQFSWSLGVLPADLEQQAGAHSSHLFDTLECRNRFAQMEISISLEQTDFSNWWLSEQTSESQAMNSNLTIREQMMGSSLEEFEENLLGHINLVTGIPRCGLNRIAFEPEEHDLRLISVKLIGTTPLSINYKHSLERLVEDDKELVSLGAVYLTRKSIALHHCALQVASQSKQMQVVTMFYCQDAACGYIDPRRGFKTAANSVNLTDIDSALDLALTVNPCSLYSVRPELYDNEPSKGPGDFDFFIRNALLASEVSFKTSKQPYALNHQAEEASSTWFKAKVSSVDVMNLAQHEDYDEKLLVGQCFGPATQLSANTNKQQSANNESLSNRLNQINSQIQWTRFNLEPHHSRRHCHLACLMRTDCQTYSHNDQSNQCVLSNIDQRHIVNPLVRLNDTVSDKNCHLFGLNSLLRFKRPFGVNRLRPVDFMAQNGPVILASAKECAFWCNKHKFQLVDTDHSNDPMDKPKYEVKQDGYCRSFVHIESSSICLLASTGQSLDASMNSKPLMLDDSLDDKTTLSHSDHYSDDDFTPIVSLAQLESLIGKEKARQLGPARAFEWDYGQFFRRVHSAEMFARVPNSIKLPIETHYTLSELECLRHCALLDGECVALDYFCERSNECTCKLHHFRSIYSLPGSLVDRVASSNNELELEIRLLVRGLNDMDTLVIAGSHLTPMESNLYMDISDSNYTLGARLTRTVTHYYLANDMLYLKRLLSQLHAYTDKHDATTMGQQIWQDEQQLGRVGQSSIAQFTAQLISGLFVGAICFIYLSPALVTTFLATIRRAATQVSFGADRRESMSSRVELAEMGDM